MQNLCRSPLFLSRFSHSSPLSISDFCNGDQSSIGPNTYSPLYLYLYLYLYSLSLLSHHSHPSLVLDLRDYLLTWPSPHLMPPLWHLRPYFGISKGGNGDANERLQVWSDCHCTIRLCGSVAKTLLVLHVWNNGSGTDSPMCLENYNIKERIITRWKPQQNRVDVVPVQSNKETDA
ncbi:hypothetical protein Ancab_022352 [Ancistrocladus abbreviatus]